MASDRIPVIRQYDFSDGPNYTGLPWTLGDKELASSTNVYWDGKLKTIPNAARVVSTALNGTNKEGTSVTVFVKANGTRYLVASQTQGWVEKLNTATNTWDNLSTSLSPAYWSWRVFNDQLIGASKVNAVQYYTGTTFGALGGSPPNFAYLENHGDYLLGAGHTAAPSDVKYSDTATATTWPAGNVLHIGLDDGQIITGLQRYGDVTFIFKERSIWILSGSTPSDFKLEKSMSDIGATAPRSIVWTDLGVFFWSEGGPAMFNGYRSYLITSRLRSLMDDVDWTNAANFIAAYYPYLKHVVVMYITRSLQRKCLIIDLKNLGGANQSQQGGTRERLPYAIWPCWFEGDGSGTASLLGPTAMCSGKASSTNLKTDVFMVFASGHVCQWDSGTNINGTKTIPTLTTKAYSLGDPSRVNQLRTLDVWTVPNSSTQVTVQYATDGGSFSTQSETPYSNVASGNLKLERLSGDGAGNYITGRYVQLKVTTNGTTDAFTLVGLESAIEPGGKRDG